MRAQNFGQDVAGPTADVNQPPEASKLKTRCDGGAFRP